MVSDEDYMQQKLENERQVLNEIQETLSKKEKETIINSTQLLKQRQEEVQDPSILPTITLDDISKTIIPVVLHQKILDSVQIQWAPQPTNGIVYFKSLIEVDEIPHELLAYIPLFCQLITEMGAHEMDYREFSQEKQMHTGKMRASPYLIQNHSDLGTYKKSILFSSYCLQNNLSSMFDLWSKLFNTPQWNEPDHIKTLILAIESNFQENLIDSGHNFAKTYASSSLSHYGANAELWNGISQYKLIQQLSVDSESDHLEHIIDKLQLLTKYLLHKNAMKVAINAEDSMFDITTKHLSQFLLDIPENKQGKATGFVQPPINKIEKTFIPIPADSNYCVMCFPTVPYTHPDYTKLMVLSYIMTNVYLHREIREKGGAYGGGASHGNGTFDIYSYRDPNIEDTLHHYTLAIQYIINGNFTEENIIEAKLSAFSALDQPVTPSQKGNSQFIMEINDEMRQINRNRLFGVNKEEVIHVALKYLYQKTHATSVFGTDQRLLDFQANEEWICIE